MGSSAVGSSGEPGGWVDVRVTARHRPPDRPPLVVREGERVTLGRNDDTWPAFVWVTNAEGTTGWVPERHFERRGGEGTALRGYDTTELRADPGDRLTVVDADVPSGWLWCADRDGNHGWIPIASVEPA